MKRFVIPLVIILIIAAGVGGAVALEHRNKPVPQTPPPQTATAQSCDQLERDCINPVNILNWTNLDRTSNKLQLLVIDNRLNTAAAQHCQDFINNNYWGHTNTATGISYVNFIANNGFDTTSLGTHFGENLNGNATFNTASQVVSAWFFEQNSATQDHRDNILNANFQIMGFAECKNTNSNSPYFGDNYFVQLFYGNK